jgi:hypothetical protein
LRRLPALRPVEQVKYSGVAPVVLCQENSGHALHVGVVRFVEPLEAVEASLQNSAAPVDDLSAAVLRHLSAGGRLV